MKPTAHRNRAAAVAAWLMLLIVLRSATGSAQVLTPNFSANPVTGCAPLVVNFTDQSVGATSWQWDLGNGVTSTQQNPSTVYFNPGTYTVRLTVTNASGSQTLTRTNYITVRPLPVADFSASVRSGCFPLRVQFTDLSDPSFGTITAWNWSFGNGASSTEQNPQYVYTEAGNFLVSLTVTNSAGCTRTITRPNYITVTPGIVPGFTASPPARCTPPETISFTNTTTGPGILSYQWNFGDGGTSTDVNPSHLYNTAGPFTVQLVTVSSLGCTDTLTQTNLVRLNNFTTAITAPATACIREAIAFQNTSAPQPVTSFWRFGDGTTSTQINPVKAYTNPGTYTVTLINQYASCTDSSTHTITINPRPVAGFTATNTIGCIAPHTVNFTDASTNAVAWLWNFGDGTTSTLQNPSHTYTNLGNYNVTLIVTNNAGCTDTLTQNNFVRIQRPVFNPLINPNEGCRLLTSSFTANTTAIDGITAWFWDFGDGATSTLQNPTHTYDSGTYTIKLRVQTGLGCIDSVVLTNRIRVGVKPNAAFSAAPLTVCAFAPVQFNNLSTGTPDQFSWNFGDGNGSAAVNPTHTYQDTGLYTIRLIVFNNRCPDTAEAIGYIRVLPPVARFNFSVNCTGTKQQVAFTDQSTQATSWLWDFGDGNTSTLQNPTHTYAALGTYNVTLTTSNGSCSHSVTRQVRLVNESPAFTADRTTLCRNEQVLFTGSVGNPANIVAHAWNFGNGTNGSGAVSTATYPASGTFTVQYITTDINGCRDTATRTNYIRVNGPVANFTNPAPQICIGNTISLQNTSTTDGQNAITGTTWVMGNGTRVTTGTNPFVYTYPAAGLYSIRLVVQDASGCTDSVQRNEVVRVLDPQARFRIIDTPWCPGSNLTFENQSTGTFAPTYQWSFGDGGTSTAASPVRSYADTGTYLVQLIVREAIGCADTLAYPIRISRPRAAFTLSDSVSICQSLRVQFTNTSTFGQSYRWDFGDGVTSTQTNPVHVYGLPGTYPVKLVVTSPGGCRDSAFATVRMGSNNGTLTYAPTTGCAPLAVTLQAATDVPLNYTWDLGDGTLVNTTDSILNHTYLAGVYLPRIIIADNGGCFGILDGTDSIRASGSRPDFDADLFVLCDRGTVQFSDSTISRDIITGYSWNFGDGGTSTLQHPVHTYTAPGSYNVTLTVQTQTGCTNSITKNAFVKVVPSPQISIGGDTSFCMPASFQLQGVWNNPDTSTLSWNWNIGGQTFIGQNSGTVQRATADTVWAQLIAVSASGCRDTATQLVVVHPLPNVFAGNDTTICLGSFATLRPIGAVSYSWSPAPTLSCTNCPNPQATPTVATQYVVTGTSPFGCANRDSMIVRVKQPFTVTATGDGTICVGSPIQLNATGAEFYQWSPATGLSNATIANPVASPPTTTTYRLVGRDSLNCFQDSATVTVVVFPYPQLNAGADTTIRSGSSIVLQPVLSPDVTSFLWTPDYNLSCTTCPNPTATPLRTTRYRLTATNAGGCSSFDEIVVRVECSKEDVFIPNAFTPNGDGLNDYFYIIGRGLASVKSLRIFNRWGNLVFERTYFDAGNRTLGWDGTYKGQPQPPGIYSYTAEVLCGDGLIIPINGTVNLIR
ncbi:MAG: PKD domain-containing protein [Lacibacter sp.]